MKYKPIWVDEDVHKSIKTAASHHKKKMNDYLKEVSEKTEEIVIQPVKRERNKWRFF